MEKNIILLGFGFTGSFLLKFLEEKGYKIFVTSRNPNNNKFLKNKENIILFDLIDEESYKNIPENSDIIWLFPAEPLEKVKKFFLTLKNTNIRIVLGTTSSYLKKEGIINEKDFLDNSIERVKGEEFLLQNGSVVLQTSGIYGYERHPFNWLNKGLIKNGNKSVNLIHINDICKIIYLFLKSDIKNERFNLSDGNKYFHKDIWELGKNRDLVKTNCPPIMELEDKFIDNSKLREFIGFDYKFEEI